MSKSQSATFPASSPGSIGGDGGHILNSSDLNTITGNGS